MSESATIKQILGRARQIAVLTHVNPDGDAIGSMLAMTLALRAHGHTANAVCAHPIPETFRFLPGVAEAAQGIPTGTDTVVAVDVASRDRLDVNGSAEGVRIDVNIDHHVSNTKFGRVNLIDADSAATGEILSELLPALGLEISEPVATCLLAALVSDTIGFSTASTTARTLERAGALVRCGAQLERIYHQIHNQRTFAAVRLWGEAFTTLEADDGLVWASLSLAAKKRAGYAGSGDADATHIVRTVRGAELAIVFVERNATETKVSWRSLTGLDVAAIASSFGGGGHAAAAGATIHGKSFEDARKFVLDHARSALTAHRAAAQSNSR